MAIEQIPGVGPQNSDIAETIAITPAVSAQITASVPSTSAIAAALPTNSSIASAVAAANNTNVTNIVQTYASAKTLYAQEFTGSTNWTAPTGVNAVRVLACAGGGGGGAVGIAVGPYAAWAGGGGGGAVIRRTVPVTPGTTYAITIGAGGNRGDFLNNTNMTLNSSGNGGNTQFGNLVIAYGGGGGAGFSRNAGEYIANINGGTGGGGFAYNTVTNQQGIGGGGGGAGGNAFGMPIIPYNAGNINMQTGRGGRGNQGGSGAQGYATAVSTTFSWIEFMYAGAGVDGMGGGGSSRGSYAGDLPGSFGGGTGSGYNGNANYYGGGGGAAGGSGSYQGGQGYQGYMQIEWMQ